MIVIKSEQNAGNRRGLSQEDSRIVAVKQSGTRQPQEPMKPGGDAMWSLAA